MDSVASEDAAQAVPSRFTVLNLQKESAIKQKEFGLREKEVHLVEKRMLQSENVKTVMCFQCMPFLHNELVLSVQPLNQVLEAEEKQRNRNNKASGVYLTALLPCRVLKVFNSASCTERASPTQELAE